MKDNIKDFTNPTPEKLGQTNEMAPIESITPYQLIRALKVLSRIYDHLDK